MAKTSVSQMSKEEKSTVNLEEITITLANTAEEVLQLNKDEGVVLVFDPKSFLELGESEIDALSNRSRANYFTALGARDALRKQAAEAEGAIARIRGSMLSPLQGASERLLRTRDRTGYHQTWVRGEDVQNFKNIGYTVVRRSQDPSELPGYESGEIWKINEDDKHDLVQMEIPLDVYEEHLAAVGRKSVSRYSQIGDEFRSKIDAINTRDTGTRKEALTPMVEIEEIEEELKNQPARTIRR